MEVEVKKQRLFSLDALRGLDMIFLCVVQPLVAAVTAFAGTAFATDPLVKELFPWFEVGEVVDEATAANGWRTVAYTCTTPLVDGEGNIDEDPRLSVRKVRYGQIKSSSPCVNAGDPTGWTADDIDLLGNPRLRKGTTIDMGCYQATLQGLLLMLK